MKIAITGDLHSEEGLYTNICIDYLNNLEEYCKKNDIKIIVFTGDILEKSSRIKNEAFLPLFFKFIELEENGFDMYFILGNHDIFNNKNDSMIEVFIKFGTVVKTSEVFEIGGHEVTMLPYTQSEFDIPTQGEYLITHLPIANFTFDNEVKASEKKAFKINLFENYKRVFSGHFHRFQEKENICYHGSPYQLSYGEKDTKKGFIVFDLDKNSYEFIEYDEAPKYKIIDIKELEKGINKSEIKNCFIKVNIDKKVEDFIKIKHLLYENGALEVKQQFISNKNEEDTKEIKIDINNSLKEMLEEYITEQEFKMENKILDKEKLLKLFHKIEKEV